MSDFLSDLLAENGVVTRIVKFNGKEGEVYFRRISAGQKAELLKGQRVQAVAGQQSTFEIDLGENANSKALMVLYAVVNQDGTQRFKKLEQVKAMDAGVLDALYREANDVNTDDFVGDDMGKG